MEKEYNENDIDWNAIEGDFMGFLEEKDYDSCNVIIDNLAEQKEFSKALELCMKRCAAIMKDRMTLPANYGEENPLEGSSVLERLVSAADETIAAFAPEDNPLNGVKVEGVEEEVIY